MFSWLIQHFFSLIKLTFCAIEELLINCQSRRISGAHYSTKLDASNSYLQIKVDNESAALLTFGTPFGRYWFKRLPFGIHSASEVFQSEVPYIISGIDGCANSQEDIIILSASKEEHDQ